jgi:hypothetical protein
MEGGILGWGYQQLALSLATGLMRRSLSFFTLYGSEMWGRLPSQKPLRKPLPKIP